MTLLISKPADHFDHAGDLSNHAADDSDILLVLDCPGEGDDSVDDSGVHLVSFGCPQGIVQHCCDPSSDFGVRPVEQSEKIVTGQDSDQATIEGDGKGSSASSAVYVITGSDSGVHVAVW